MCDVQNGVSALPRMSAAAAPRVPRERTPHAAPGRHLPTHGPNVGAREAGQGGRGEGGGAMGGLGGARSGAGSARRHAPRRARTPVTACWGNGGAHLLSTPSARHLAVHLGSGACDGLNPFPLSTPLPALLKRRLPPRPWGRLRTPSKAPAYCLEGAGCRPGRGQQTSRRALHGTARPGHGPGTARARHGHGMGTAWTALLHGGGLRAPRGRPGPLPMVSHGRPLYKARLTRVSSRPAWGLPVRGSSPLWPTAPPTDPRGIGRRPPWSAGYHPCPYH